jgi:MOSC domain-containing protein YiiM
MTADVLAVHVRSDHGFSKTTAPRIRLLAGLGVEGDAHCGSTVRHRSRVARDPTQPNLRQVHLLQAELLDELRAAGFHVDPGAMGENITTRGIDLLALPEGTRLLLGADAELLLTGLRNPCGQIDDFQPGLMAAVLDRTPDGQLVRKAGVMATVLRGGVVSAHDRIVVRLPTGAQVPLQPV